MAACRQGGRRRRMMAVVDYAALPEFPMRAGITGKGIAGSGHGSTSVSVLSNTAQPGAAAPGQFHEYEEVVIVEGGLIGVELDGSGLSAGPGQSVIIPPL